MTTPRGPSHSSDHLDIPSDSHERLVARARPPRPLRQAQVGHEQPQGLCRGGGEFWTIVLPEPRARVRLEARQNRHRLLACNSVSEARARAAIADGASTNHQVCPCNPHRRASRCRQQGSSKVGRAIERE